MNRLHIARLDAAKIDHPEDGEYVWISLDGEQFFEVSRAPSENEEAEWVENLLDVTDPARRVGRSLPMSMHVRLLHHYGAVILAP